MNEIKEITVTREFNVIKHLKAMLGVIYKCESLKLKHVKITGATGEICLCNIKDLRELLKITILSQNEKSL